jgi:hypothetical protein
MAAPAVIAARTLAEAYALRATATRLLLRASPDVRCVNLMCEHVGGGCACRVALSVGRMPCLTGVDLADNGLPTLPDSLWDLPHLAALAAGGNRLAAFPAAGLTRLPSLAALDVSHNAIASVPWEQLAGHPSLRLLVLSGNPLSPGEVARGAALLAARGVRVVAADGPPAGARRGGGSGDGTTDSWTLDALLDAVGTTGGGAQAASGGVGGAQALA